MAKFSAPPRRFPIGNVQLPGQGLVNVYPDNQFWEYIVNIFERIGGANGLSSDELAALVEMLRTESQTSAGRRPAALLAPDPVIPKSNTSEVKALQDKVTIMEAQLDRARMNIQVFASVIADLQAQMRKLPDLNALARRVSDLETM